MPQRPEDGFTKTGGQSFCHPCQGIGLYRQVAQGFLEANPPPGPSPLQDIDRGVGRNLEEPQAPSNGMEIFP